MKGFYNLSMSYRLDGDIVSTYGRFVQIRDHPEGDELVKYIERFGEDNKHIAEQKDKDAPLATQIVSHCKTVSGREELVRMMKKLVTVHVYGSCGSLHFPCEKHIEHKHLDTVCPSFIA